MMGSKADKENKSLGQKMHITFNLEKCLMGHILWNEFILYYFQIQ